MKNNNEGFRVRAYGRTELAKLYSPELKPQSAYKRLLMWIYTSPELSELLLENGKPAKSRIFTPYKVKNIVRYLGEP